MNDHQKVAKKGIHLFDSKTLTTDDDDENDFTKELSIHIQFAVYLCNSNRLDKFEIWFNNISKCNSSLLFNLMKNEDFCLCIVRLRFFQENYELVFQLLKSSLFSAREEYIKLWEEAHYKQKEKTLGHPLTPLQRFRIRKKFPPPPNICPYGRQIINPLFKQASVTLKHWFQEHAAYPYPNIQEKEMLAQQTGLTLYQVKTWFANTRRRKKVRQMRSGMECRKLLNKSHFLVDSEQLVKGSTEALDLSIQNIEKNDLENVLINQEEVMDSDAGWEHRVEKADGNLIEESIDGQGKEKSHGGSKKSHRCCFHCPEFNESALDLTDHNTQQAGQSSKIGTFPNMNLDAELYDKLNLPNIKNSSGGTKISRPNLKTETFPNMNLRLELSDKQNLVNVENSSGGIANSRPGLKTATFSNMNLGAELSAEQNLDNVKNSSGGTKNSKPISKNGTFSNKNLKSELSDKQNSTTEPNSSEGIQNADLFQFLLSQQSILNENLHKNADTFTPSSSSDKMTESMTYQQSEVRFQILNKTTFSPSHFRSSHASQDLQVTTHSCNLVPIPPPIPSPFLTSVTQTLPESVCPNHPVLTSSITQPVNLVAFKQDGGRLPVSENSFNSSVLLRQGIQNTKFQEQESYPAHLNLIPSCSSEYPLATDVPATDTLSFAVLSLPNTNIVPLSEPSVTSRSNSHHFQIIPASNINSVQLNNETWIRMPRSCDPSPSTSHDTLSFGTPMSTNLDHVTGTKDLLILETEIAHTLLRLSRRRE